MEYKRDLVPGIVLCIFSILYLVFSTQIEIFTGSGATPLDARFVPRLWGSCLLILSVMLIFRGLKAKRQITENNIERKMSLKELVYDNREVWLTFLALAIYMLGLKPIGFMIMTAVYIFFQIIILTEKSKINYKLALIVAIPTAVFIDYIFVELLYVMLPTGIFGF